MFNIGALAKNVLDSIDNVAKETLEEPGKMSATALRRSRKQQRGEDDDFDENEDADDDIDGDEIEETVGDSVPPWEANAATAVAEGTVFVGDMDGKDAGVSDVRGDDIKEEEHSYERVGPIPSSPSQSSVASSQGLHQQNVPEQPVLETQLFASMPSTPAVTAATSSKAADPGIAVDSNAVVASSADPGSDAISAATPTMMRPPKTKTSFGAVTGSSSKAGTAGDSEAELKRVIRKKNQEIEKLNQECLELEEQCTALKHEVHEAWDNYKQAQEKAAAAESERQDEMKQIQRAKALDKQQSVAEINRLQTEMAEMKKALYAADQEKDLMQSRLSDATEVTSQWAERVSTLEQELMQSRAGGAQGVQQLRDELHNAHLLAEQTRNDHAALVRHNQQRQQELEEENGQLSNTVTTQQKELEKLQQQLQMYQENSGAGSGFVVVGNSAASAHQSDSNVYINKDNMQLQQEVLELSAQVEQLQESNLDFDRKVKLLEREKRAAQMSYEDERKRTSAVVEDMGAQIASLEGRLKEKKSARKSSMFTESIDGSSEQQGINIQFHELDSDGRAATAHLQKSIDYSEVSYDDLVKELKEHRIQSQNLSKLLLKKQGTVLELQAERSSLKSRVMDLQNRCTHTEQQLAALRDLEEDDPIDLHYADSNMMSPDASSYSSGSNTITSSGLQRRGGGMAASESAFGSSSNALRRGVVGSRVITDLEKIGVKPGEGVSRAVNAIDSWTLFVGRLLRIYPLARLCFVLYLLGMHLWVLFILVLHTHSLEIAMDPREHPVLNP